MDVPSFNINQIFQLRDRIVTRVFYPRFGQTVEDNLIDELVAALKHELPNDVTVDTIYETVRQLVPAELNEKMALVWAWRLAGNIPQLKARRTVRAWTMQQVDEWVPLQVMSVHPIRGRRGDIRYEMQLRALAGTCAPMRIRKTWTRTIMHALSRRIGFTKQEGNRPFLHPVEYTNLRFAGLVEAVRSTDGPFFHRVECTSSFETWNKEILDRRHKLKYPCPRGWRHPCHQCAIGYDQCPAGTHHLTYVMQECTKCGKSAPFEPGSTHCVTCTQSERLRQHG